MSTLHTYFTYAMNRSEPPSDHSAPDAQDATVDDAPTIHRQHNSNRDDDEDEPPRVTRPRNRVMDLLRAAWGLTADLANSSELDETDSDLRDGQGSGDEREDEVIETLEMIVRFEIIKVDNIVQANLGFRRLMKCWRH